MAPGSFTPVDERRVGTAAEAQEFSELAGDMPDGSMELGDVIGHAQDLMRFDFNNPIAAVSPWAVRLATAVAILARRPTAAAAD